MKAIVIDHYGSPQELHKSDIPVPQIKEDEVLVKMKATSVNPVDWKIRLGFLKNKSNPKFPIVLGWDVSGVIVKVGSQVDNFKVGDKVFGVPDRYPDGKLGTYTQYTKIKADKLALIPSKLSFEQAAAIPLAGLTAWQVVVDRLKVKAGDKILIQAGAGGVGMFAIQIAKHLGAYVATTASPQNEQLLKKLGADKVINYHKYSIDEVLHDYDAVFDTINQISRGLKILKPTGKLVTIFGTNGPTKDQQNGHPSASTWWLQTNGKELKQLAKLVDNNELQVVIDSTFPLTTEGVRSAQRKSETNRSRGKIIIKIS